MSDTQGRYRQNDPDRAQGLISDAQGEFVQQHPGGAFDPHAFHSGRPAAPPAEAGEDHPAGEPPMTGERMTAPDGELAKTEQPPTRYNPHTRVS
ncbi:hypothetical protein AB0F72_13435 [Actinoplanes sp. NPDC023936]|uniref:hypothetical protein n=1 Tax=Actinoplanes sp. NPDC023936 TaxID=3154910 RepID=UPI0033EE6CD0